MTIAVDFDGTLVTHEYPRIGKPIPFAIDTLKKLQQEGHQIILWSVREGHLLQEAVDYCAGRGFEFYAVNTNYPEEAPEDRPNRKVTADLYIDDRNLGGLPDWGIIYQMVHSGRAHQPAPSANMVADKPRHSAQPHRSFLSRLFR